MVVQTAILVSKRSKSLTSVVILQSMQMRINLQVTETDHRWVLGRVTCTNLTCTGL